MRRIYFNLPEKLILNEKIKLNPENIHYLTNVLRVKFGEKIQIFDGNCEYIAIFEKNIILIQEKLINTKLKSSLKLAVSNIKKERLEWLVEKATELNVAEIFLINFERTQKININYERLIKISIESAKQCKRIDLPIINTCIDFDVFLNKHDLTNWCVANIDGEEVKNNDLIGVIIGPEGGFSLKEINKMKNIKKIKLNQNILRTETAAIAGICFIL